MSQSQKIFNQRQTTLSGRRSGAETGAERKEIKPACYILRLTSGNIYVGSTIDFERRWLEHKSGKGGRTTKIDPPVEVLRVEKFESYAQAYKREIQLKGWSKAKKEALITGNLKTLHQQSKSREK